MKIAIIPARGGSKRIPGKNIREFCGKPMIAWSIRAALDSMCFDRVIVSTDDNKIANIARNHGAEVPFQRPAELSDDHVGTTPVMRHAIEWLDKIGEQSDLACCIYATAPFISAASIRQGYKAMKANNCEFAFSVTRFLYPIERALLQKNGRVEMINPKTFNTRSQDLEERFHDAGQFYWGTRQAWLSEKEVLNSDSMPINLASHLVQDIDTLEDWQRAEWMYRANQMSGEIKAA